MLPAGTIPIKSADTARATPTKAPRNSNRWFFILVLLIIREQKKSSNLVIPPDAKGFTSSPPSVSESALNIPLHRRPVIAGFSIGDLAISLIISSTIAVLAISTKSFWGDEIHSIHAATRAFPDLLNTLAADYHPPLYFLLLKIWVDTAGSSEVSLRIFQGIQGFILFLASLALFRRFFPQTRYQPFWLLLIISSELWLLIPMLRYYTLSAILSVGSTLLFLRWLDDRKPARAAALMIAYAALLYTQYLAAAVIVIHAVFVAVRNRDRIGHYAGILAGSLLSFGPWILVAMSQVRQLLLLEEYADLNDNPFVIVLKLAFSLYAFVAGETSFPYEPLVMVAGGAALIIILHTLIRSRSQLLSWPIVAGCSVSLAAIVSTSVVTTFISIHTSFIYTPARTLFALPFFFLMLGGLLGLIAKPPLRTGLIAAFLVLNVYGIGNWILNRHFLQPVYATPWKEVLDELEGQDGIVVADEDLCFEYYHVRTQNPLPPLWNGKSESDQEAWQKGQTVFLILTGRDSSPPGVREDVVQRIRERGTLVKEQKYVVLKESYRRFKGRITGRDSYDAKLTLYTYQLR